MNHDAFSQRVFRAPTERGRRFAMLALQYIPPQPAPRLLDIGCGTGEELAHLVEALPESFGVGVDISAPNIALAEAGRTGLPAGGRLRFLAMDYFAFADAPFDAIVSDSTLHLIPAPNDKLFGKIAQDLKPGGLLICSVPYDCAYNRFLWTIRRFFRLIRSPLTDRFIYGMGRLLQGKKISSELLWDRVHYMYLLPHCIFSSNFNALLSGHYGLECVAEVSLPWASVAQPRHRLFVYRKVSPGSRRPMND